MKTRLFPKLTVLCLAVILLLCLACPTYAYNVVRSAQKLTVDGKAVECEKYNIDGYNYYKLRDLAMLLNGTGSQFDLGWDAEAGMVTITTQCPYTSPTGTELTVGPDRSATAQVSAQTILFDADTLPAGALKG